MLHKTSALGEQHFIQQWEVADATALAALSLIATDVGKIARQLDTNEWLLLIDHSPASWLSLDVPGAISDLAAAIAAAYQPLDAQLTSLAGLAFTGNTLKVVRVNAAETAFEFADAGAGGGREVLTAVRTYYVRTDGSDSNTGLADTAGGAFLTIQKAVDTVLRNLDRLGYTVTIKVADGTYTGAISVQGSEGLGSGIIQIEGNTGTPENVLITVTGANAVVATGPVYVLVTGFKLSTITSGSTLTATVGARIQIGAIQFGACASSHITASYGGHITATAPGYTINGAATYHWYANNLGNINITSKTITITGTPAFSFFAIAQSRGYAGVGANTFSGSATGARYYCSGAGVVDSNGGGSTYLPGNSAGSTATGGAYY